MSEKKYNACVTNYLTRIIPGEFYKIGTEYWYYVQKNNGWFQFRKCRFEVIENICYVTNETVNRTEDRLWWLKRANEIDRMVEVIFEKEDGSYGRN
jgi:hypothetical protein